MTPAWRTGCWHSAPATVSACPPPADSAPGRSPNQRTMSWAWSTVLSSFSSGRPLDTGKAVSALQPTTLAVSLSRCVRKTNTVGLPTRLVKLHNRPCTHRSDTVRIWGCAQFYRLAVNKVDHIPYFLAEAALWWMDSTVARRLEMRGKQPAVSRDNRQHTSASLSCWITLSHHQPPPQILSAWWWSWHCIEVFK